VVWEPGCEFGLAWFGLIAAVSDCWLLVSRRGFEGLCSLFTMASDAFWSQGMARVFRTQDVIRCVLESERKKKKVKLTIGRLLTFKSWLTANIPLFLCVALGE
jgi:hypothetical protein